MVKVSSRSYIQESVGDRADQVIQAATKMSLIVLIISSFGIAVAIVFCCLAALGSAVAAGRTSPTRLLQER